jgi:hypothetical protein
MINQYFNPENPSQIWANDGVRMNPMPFFYAPEDCDIDTSTGEMTLRTPSLPLRPVYRLSYFFAPRNSTIEQLKKELDFLDHQWIYFRLGEQSIYSSKLKRVGG